MGAAHTRKGTRPLDPIHLLAGGQERNHGSFLYIRIIRVASSRAARTLRVQRPVP